MRTINLLNPNPTRAQVGGAHQEFLKWQRIAKAKAFHVRDWDGSEKRHQELLAKVEELRLDYKSLKAAYRASL